MARGRILNTPQNTENYSIGGAQADRAFLGTEDDTVQGNGGNGTLGGILGIDTAVYSGNYADHLVKAISYGLQVSHLNAGSDGVDLLLNINKLLRKGYDRGCEMGEPSLN